MGAVEEEGRLVNDNDEEEEEKNVSMRIIEKE